MIGLELNCAKNYFTLKKIPLCVCLRTRLATFGSVSWSCDPACWVTASALSEGPAELKTGVLWRRKVVLVLLRYLPLHDMWLLEWSCPRGNACCLGYHTPAPVLPGHQAHALLSDSPWKQPVSTITSKHFVQIQVAKCDAKDAVCSSWNNNKVHNHVPYIFSGVIVKWNRPCQLI